MWYVPGSHVPGGLRRCGLRPRIAQRSGWFTGVRGTLSYGIVIPGLAIAQVGRDVGWLGPMGRLAEGK